MVALAHTETRHVSDAKTPGQFFNDKVVRPRALPRIDELRAKRDMLVATAL
jgi:hypothetical protein